MSTYSYQHERLFTKAADLVDTASVESVAVFNAAHVYVSEGAPEPGASGVQAHSVHSRARVDIVRI